MYTAAYGLRAVSSVRTVNPVDGNPGDRARPSTMVPPFTRPRTTTRRRPSGMTRPRDSCRPGPNPASSRSLRAAPRGTLKHIGEKLMGASENILPVPLTSRSELTLREQGSGDLLYKRPDNRYNWLVSALGGGGGGASLGQISRASRLEIRKTSKIHIGGK